MAYRHLTYSHLWRKVHWHATRAECSLKASYLCLPCRFLKLQPCGKNGYSPLHLAVDRNTTCVGRYPVCKFPSLTVASILLECGADVNSRDEDNNRSLLIISFSLSLFLFSLC